MKKQFLSLAFLLASACAYSQTSYLSELLINNRQVEKTADRQVKVSFDADLSGLDMKRQQSLRVVPVIVSADGSQEVELPAFVINGTVRDKVNVREAALGNTSAEDGALLTVRRKNGTSQSVNYETSVPFKRWMIGGNLQLRGYATGCAQCNEGNETNHTGDILPPMNPQYGSPFVQPKEEEVKRRSETRTARLQFRQGSSVIQKDYQQNAKELDAVHNSMQLVKDNSDLTITGIYVTGYASPEGGFDFNMKLSERRAKAFAEYMKDDLSSIDPKLYHVDWKGEDWEGLRAEIDRQPQLQERSIILDVLNGCGDDKDACEQKIRQTVSPAAYNQLLTEVYPPIRRNEYRIEYNVRHFEVEEGKQMIKSRPDLMSVNEIQQVADAYGKGTSQYIDCLLAGAKAYPQDITAQNNAALALIEAGRTEEAVALLQKAPQDAALQNMLGVAYLKQGNTEDARSMFRRAASAGNAQAQANLKMLEDYIEYYAE